MPDIPLAFVEQYSSILNHLAQQRMPRFEGTLEVFDVHGKTRYIEQLGASIATPVTTRTSPTPQITPDFERRALFVQPYQTSELIDDFDHIGLLIDPTSELARNQIYSLNRAKDLQIINAALGTAYTGVNGTTAVTLPSSQLVANNYTASGTATSTNLTLAKLGKTRQILLSNEAIEPGEQLYMAVNSKQLEGLLVNVDQVANYLYNQVKTLVDGNVDSFYGFKFVRTEQLPLDSTGNYRACFAWAKSGLALGIGEGLKTRVDIRPDLSHAIQVRTTQVFGATRLEEKKVVQINCDETNI